MKFRARIKFEILFVLICIITSVINSDAQVLFGEEEVIADLSSVVRDVGEVLPVDLDQDGDLDLIATSGDNDQIVWLENLDGQGVFGAQQLISDQIENPRRLVYTDMNGDAIPDLLVGAGSTFGVTWLEHLDGRGTFGTPTRVVSGGNTVIRPADVDDDGDIDVIRASGDRIYWHENFDGNGTFPFSGDQITPLAADVRGMEVADLDGDGDLDVISASSGNDLIAWYENIGGGDFNTQVKIEESISYPIALKPGDVDGDGDIDIVAAFRDSNTIGWYENLNGQADFSAIHVITNTFENVQTFSLSDLDGDLDLDVVANSLFFDLDLKWFENDGSGNFETDQLIAETTLDNAWITVADMDGNGVNDIINSAWNSIFLYRSSPVPGIFEPGSIISTLTRNPGNHQLADIDGDGDIDFVAISQSDHQIYWYPNKGNGAYETPVFIAPYIPGISRTEIIDLDEDGDLDVIANMVIDGDYSIVWFENVDGNGHFGLRQFLADVNLNAVDFESSDLDGDGDQDLVFIGEIINSDELSWIEKLDNSPRFGPQKTLVNFSNFGVSRLNTIDFDEDGDQDILYYSNDRFRWLENEDGQGNFGAIAQSVLNMEFVRATEWTDFDGDGDDDLILFRNDLMQIEWYEKINGLAQFSAAEIITPVEIDFITDEHDIHVIKLADIDLDGDKDLIVAGDYDGALQSHSFLGYHLNRNGTNNFSNRVNIKTRLLGELRDQVFIFDADDDNDVDVIWQLVRSTNVPGEIRLYRNLDVFPRISGLFFLDENENKIRDNGEAPLLNQSVVLAPTGITSYSDRNGQYYFVALPGMFEIQSQIDPLWNLTTDFTNYTVNSNGNSIAGFDFGLSPNQMIQNIDISSAAQITRCNTNTPFWINFTNTGTVKADGLITLIKDQNTTFVNAVPSPDSVVNDTVYWNFENLNPTQNNRIKITMNMPGSNLIGAPITFISTAYLKQNNALIKYDSDRLNATLLCAYDPNDKLVKPAGLDNEGYILNTDTLRYTIRFQNTGNDTAFLVSIVDQLDTDLDFATFQPIASSHDYYVTKEEDGKLVFRFENILLPDSTTNIIESQGFVTYSIQPKSNLPRGRRIENFADIYFDFNPRIQTNELLNTIYECDDELDIELPDLDLCEGEEFRASANDLIDATVFNWSIENILMDTGRNFNWIIDTAGTFELLIRSTNDLCQKDTLIQLEILSNEKPLILDTVEIIPGDSILIFNQFQDEPGVYFDTLMATNGCDSLIGIRLLFNTSTAIQELKKRSVHLYPNPFQHSLTIDANQFNLGSASLRLYTPTGRLLREIVIERGIQILHTDEIPSGIYFYELLSKTGIRLEIGKLIKHY